MEEVESRFVYLINSCQVQGCVPVKAGTACFFLSHMHLSGYENDCP